MAAPPSFDFGPPVSPPPSPPPSPGPGGFVLDPFAIYSRIPSAYDSAQLFALALRPVQVDPALVRGVDLNRICVWHCLGLMFGLDPLVLWCVFLASVSPVTRVRLAHGPVPQDLLPAVCAFFRVGVVIHACVPGPQRSFLARDTSPPVFSTTAPDGWPTAVWCAIQMAGSYHVVVAHPSFSPVAAPPPLDARLTIGYATRIVSYAEIEGMMNIPLAFYQVYDHLLGRSLNAAAAGSSAFGFPLRGPQGLLPFVPLLSVPLAPQVIQYTVSPVDRQLAMNLASDMKAHPAVLEAVNVDARQVVKAIDSMVEYVPARTVELVLLNGLPGVGKSFAFDSLLQQYAAEPDFNSQTVRLHSWRSPLRSQLRRDHAPMLDALLANSSSRDRSKGYNFPSGCSIFYEACSGTLFLDDAGLLWPGTIPMLCLIHPALRRIVVSFDSAQTRSVFPDANSLTRGDPSTVEWLAGFSDSYATEQRRLSIENSATFGLPIPAPAPGYVPSHGSIYVVSKPPPGIPLFVASPRFAETKNNGGQPCITFADSQGLSFDGDIAIDVGGLTDAMTDNIIWPVLTRCRHNIFIVVSPQLPSPKLLVEPSYGCSRIMSAILAVSARANTAMITPLVDTDRVIARAVHSHLSRSLSLNASVALGLPAPAIPVAGPPSQLLVPMETVLSSINRPGVRAPRPSRVLNLAPPVVPGELPRQSFVKDALRWDWPVTQDTFDFVPVDPDPVPPPIPFSVVDPALVHFDVASPESREVRAPGILSGTSQIPEDSSPLGLRHRRGDLATERLSELKRIRVGEDSATLTGKGRARLRQLKRGFRKFVDIPDLIPFSEDLFELALAEAPRSWLQDKSKADIERSMLDSQPGWSDRFTRLFLKSQLVKKLGVRGKCAKAGQTVATFPKWRIFEDAVWANYVQRVVESRRSRTTFFLNKSINVMRKWYRCWRPGPCTASDYTAWDSGCDDVFVAFDCWLLRSCGVPEHYVAAYSDRKFSTRCYLGPVMPMQFSGDRWTWLFNTTRNVALTGAAFNCPAGTPAAFSGDDMILCGDFHYNDDFHPSDWLMQPKLERGHHLEFCGFTFGEPSFFVAPKVMLHRAQLAFGSGRQDPAFWDSFDFALRYSKDAPESATAAAISLAVRERYALPPSRFPLSFST